MEDDGNGLVQQFNPVRDVFVYEEFIRCYDRLVRERGGKSEEYRNKFNNTAYNFMTLQDLKPYFKKMGYEQSSGTKHTICRIRLTAGEHLETGISRIYFCYAKDIPSLRQIKHRDGDVVLLYFTFTANDHDNTSEIYKLLDKDITTISNNKLERTNKLKIIKNNLIYQYIRNDEDEYNAVPVLSSTQSLYLTCCELHPPCIIHGSAGSGKTILSEELYKKFSEKKTENTLYITYMEQLKLQVSYDLRVKRNIKNTECKTIDDIVRNYLGEEEFKKRYKKESDFKKWLFEDAKLNSQCIYDKYKGGVKDLLSKINKDTELAASIVYIFFRTFSTEPNYRSFCDNPNKGTLSDAAYFLKLCEYEEGLDRDQKNRVFYLCQKYEKYLKENNYVNDNEAARRITEKNVREYDNIIVDEVQDLTETQIKCLTTLLKKDSTHFYVFGDDNQTINPTLMDISDVRTCLRQYLNKKIDFPENIEEKLAPLDVSFRSTAYIVRYINYINDIRRRSIGKNKSYNEQDQKTAFNIVSNNESDYPAYILDKENPGLSESCLIQKDIVALNNVVIITANEKTKNDLLTKYPHLRKEGADYVCTIEETKGREWDQVILYNFFSSAKTIWENITRNKADIENDTVSKGRHSSIYRMYFNRYYVGLTRAKNKIIVIETGDISGKIKDTYFPARSDVKDVSLEHLKDKKKFNNYFENDHTHDVWDEDAYSFFKKNDYNEALIRQQKAIIALDSDEKLTESDKSRFKKEYELRYERYSAYKCVWEKQTIDSKASKQYVSLFIQDKRLDFMKMLYESNKERQKLSLLNMDPRHDCVDYLKTYEPLKERFTEEEKEFFDSNAVIAYIEVINRLLKGEI